MSANLKSLAISITFILAAVSGANAELHDSGLHPSPKTGPYTSLSTAQKNELGLVGMVDLDWRDSTWQWHFDAEEYGDYQMGMAWVELKSRGKVRVSLKVNGEEIKAVTAGREVGPTRLETRFESISKGDRIGISAIPEDGTLYRLGFHLINTTPIFPNLEIYRVADYGAKGDGKTDDFEAIHATVAAARKNGGGVIRFEADKVYRTIGAKSLEYEAVFNLKDARNIKIEGMGSTLILHPPDGFADIQNATNIHIDGFFVDYSPIPYYQGAILDINLEDMTIDLEVPDRYPPPLTGTVESNAPFFGRSFIPNGPGARTGSGNNIYVESVKALNNPYHIRIQVPKTALGSDTPNAGMRKRVERAKREAATEFVVPHMLYGHRDGQTKILTSGRIKLSNLEWSMVPYFWLSVRDNYGPVTFDNVDILVQEPETELFASWRDAMHIKNARFGTTILNADIDGAAIYDDTFAIYTRTHRVLALEQNHLNLAPAFRDHKDMDTWKPGDWVSVWSGDQEELRGMARLQKARDIQGANHFHLYLENNVPGAEPGDIVINEEVLNRHTLIRDSRTGSVGTENSSNRFRASDIHFENNHFEDFDFHVEFDAFWGTPRSRDIHVSNTYIGGGESRVNLNRAIDATFSVCRFENLLFRTHKLGQNIRISDSEWLNAPATFLHLGPESLVVFDGSNRVNGKPAVDANGAKLDGLIQTGRGKNLSIKSP